MAPPGRRRAPLSPTTLALTLAFLFASSASAASAVLGIDLGTEYLKAALVKPGIPLEIVLTKDSKRKETAAVAFKPGKNGAQLELGAFPERFYGGDAVALQARFPGEVWPNLKHLLGVGEAEVVKMYGERYPALKVVKNEGRGTVSFTSGVFAEGVENTFSVEELLAMELKNVRENAKALAGKGYDIQDVVFTVPPFYTVAEKRALEVASRLAGMKVLSVITDGMAVGVNYATSRTFPDVSKEGKPEVNLVFDMGAGSTSATVLKFQGNTVKDTGKYNKTVQEIHVLGTGWDRSFGGDMLNSLIVDDMVSQFVKLPGAKSASISAASVKSHGRTAAKLFKEAERVRQVLSANSETSQFFEGLYEDVDFRYKLSRTRFEELAASYASRVDRPIQKALEAAGLTYADIDSVIVHGGATRTPFVQSRLESLVGKAKIRANVNSDEAAVFGAAFKAATISPSFRVKEIRDYDVQGYKHGMTYTLNGKEKDQRIFTPLTKVGTAKDIPFQRTEDFDFTIYEELPGSTKKQSVLQFQSGNLTATVAKLIEKDNCAKDSFGTFVQVKLSSVTGSPEVTNAWVTCEGDETKGGIVDGVKNLFGMGGKKDQEVLKDGESVSDSASKSSSSAASSSSANAKASDAAKGEKKKKAVRSPISFEVKQLGYEKMPKAKFGKMVDRLAAFDASDRSRRIREEVLNSLEAFTYRARDYLDDESFATYSTAAARSSLEEKLSAASDWIYAEGAEASEKVLKARLKELEDIVNPVLKRKSEASKRPEALKEFKGTLDHLKEVIQLVNGQIQEQITASSKSSEAVSKASAEAEAASSAAASVIPSADPLADLDDEELLQSSSSSSSSAAPEITPVPTVYTESDVKSLEDASTTAQKWLHERESAQAKLNDHDDPAYTLKDLEAQKKKVDDLIQDMMLQRMRHLNQPKYSRSSSSRKPRASKKPKKAASSSSSATSSAPAAQTPADYAEPSEEELAEALRAAGIKEGDGLKLKAFGPKGPSQMVGQKGQKLDRLDLNPESTEEEILEAIDRLTERARKQKGEKEGHDEL